MEIEVIDIPGGEAPLAVRESWVGIRLPLVKKGTVTPRAFGVLSSPRNIFSWLYSVVLGKAIYEESYLVNSAIAIERLKTHNPTAAQWWCENTNFENRKKVFAFQKYACKETNNDS